MEENIVKTELVTINRLHTDLQKLESYIYKSGFTPLYIQMSDIYYDSLKENGLLEFIDITPNWDVEDKAYACVLKDFNIEVIVDEDIREGFKIIWR